MGDLINLKRFKKAKARAAKRAKGDENAVKHGRTKAETQSQATQNDKAIAKLDGHRREPE